MTDKGMYIKAELYSRPNATNGKYRACQIGLDNLAAIKDSDIFLLESLQKKANLADKIIAESESQGKNTTDLTVLKQLGIEINTRYTPIHRGESVMTALFVSLRLILTYGVSIGIWGLVFKKSFLVFSLFGGIAGFMISFIFVAPVIAVQKSRERIRDMVTGVDVMFSSVATIIGIAGLVTWAIRSIFS